MAFCSARHGVSARATAFDATRQVGSLQVPNAKCIVVPTSAPATRSQHEGHERRAIGSDRERGVVPRREERGAAACRQCSEADLRELVSRSSSERCALTCAACGPYEARMRPKPGCPRRRLASILPLVLSVAGPAQVTPNQAEDMHRRHDWAGAAAAYQELARTNPFQGQFTFRLGECYLRLQRYDDAIDALKKTRELGHDDAGTMNLLGWCHRRSGDLEQAAYWFDRLIDSDPGMIAEFQKAPLRRALGEELATRLLGPPLPPDVGRVEGWRTDLAHLTRTLFRSHYDITVRTPQAVWDRRTRELHDAIPNLTDKKIALEFMRLVALAGDGHTCVWPMFNKRFAFGQLPVLIYRFADGFFVKAADKDHESLVGARVTRIGTLTIEDVFARSSEYVGHENAMHARMTSPGLMGTTEILEAIGATADDRKVALTIEQDGHEKAVTVTAIPWDSSLYGDRDTAPGWRSMNADAKTPVPLYLKDSSNAYWYEYLPSTELVYFYYGNVFEKPGEPFATFLDRLFAFIESNPVSALVIDLRLNFGGSSELYAPLVKKLIAHPKVNQPGKLFAITGRGTYSATVNLVTDLEYWTHAIFVGEPASAPPNFIGENRLVLLPYCGSRVSISNRYHQHGASDSSDKRAFIPPTLAAELTSVQFRDNVDPALDAILRFLDAPAGQDRGR